MGVRAKRNMGTEERARTKAPAELGGSPVFPEWPRAGRPPRIRLPGVPDDRSDKEDWRRIRDVAKPHTPRRQRCQKAEAQKLPQRLGGRELTYECSYE